MKNKLTSAVIMSTYNGEEYILEQLNSLKNQNLSPDSVYIRDDGSSDQTVDIITRFIFENELSNWSLIRNEQNVGWRRNFMQLLDEASEDIIFFSDQDDIWYADKIEKTLELMSTDSEIKVLVSDYDLFGEAGGDEKMLPFSETNVAPNLYRVSLTLDNILIKRDGMSIAVRRDFVPEIIKSYDIIDCDAFGFPQAHDLITWITAILNNGLYHTDVKLVNHRIHSTSTWAKESQKRTISPTKQIENLIQFYNKIRLQAVNEGNPFEKVLNLKLNDLLLEKKLLSSRSYILWFLSFRQFSSIKRYLGFLRRNL